LVRSPFWFSWHLVMAAASNIPTEQREAAKVGMRGLSNRAVQFHESLGVRTE